jgi:hypothetical protein
MYPTLDDSITFRARFLATICSLVLVFLIVTLVRKGRLKEGYSILWLVMSGAILVFAVFSELLFGFSNLIGIFYAPATLFIILIVNLLLIAIHYSVSITDNEQKIKDLAQEVGLLKHQLEKLQKKKK